MTAVIFCKAPKFGNNTVCFLAAIPRVQVDAMGVRSDLKKITKAAARHSEHALDEFGLGQLPITSGVRGAFHRIVIVICVQSLPQVSHVVIMVAFGPFYVVRCRSFPHGEWSIDRLLGFSGSELFIVHNTIAIGIVLVE